MTRTIRTPRWIAPLAVAAAIATPAMVSPAGAAATQHWSKSQCALQQALFNVRHPHPSGLELAGANRTLKHHGCAARVPGPKHWTNTQCSDYQATFLKLYAFPTNARLATANKVLKTHGCSQRVRRPPTQQ